MSKWRCILLRASSAGPMVVLSIVLVSMTSAPFVSVGSAGTSESWTSYFPTAIGRTCTLTLPPETTSSGTNAVTTKGTQVETLLAVDATRAGEEYTFRMKIVMYQNETAPIVPAALSSTTFDQTVKYLVLKNGTVEAPQVNEQNEFGFTGHLLFPSISDIAKGKSSSSQLRFWYSSSTPAGLQSIEAVTKGHVKSLEGTIEYRVSGTLRSSISTPSGIFHNVIGIRETLAKVLVLNANSPQIATELEAELRSSAQATTTTFWYARQRGMVSRWDVSSDGTKTVEDPVCALK
jgi:hypothetical protein